MNNIDVCLSPALFSLYERENHIVVVIDVIRASASICTALANGVKQIYPVDSIDEALHAQKKGHLISGERNSLKLEGFDFGNSPLEFCTTRLNNCILTMTTTNGTHAIMIAKSASSVLIGSFINFEILVNYLQNQNKNVILLCSGWQQKPNIEDTLFAGKVSLALMQLGKFASTSDSVSVATELYLAAESNIFNYIIDNSPRLKSKLSFLENDIRYCLYGEQINIIPMLKGNCLFNSHNL